jgi:nitrate reductase cytochrome c-type subunit
MSGTFNDTSVWFAAASVSAVDSDGTFGIDISTSGEASLTGPGAGAGAWEHPNASNTDRLARTRSFMATYPFQSSEIEHNYTDYRLATGMRQTFPCHDPTQSNNQQTPL